MKKTIPFIFFIFVAMTGCGQTVNNVESPTLEPPDEIIVETEIAFPANIVEGRVVDAHNNAIANAIVRLQASDIFTTSNAAGFFRFDEIDLNEPQSFTAWQEGYFINNAIASKEEQNITIILEEISGSDNIHYAWLSSINADGQGEDQGCAECHSATETEPVAMLPVDEWLLDAHSQSAVNQRFLTVYNGTDTSGNQSLETVFIPANPSRKNNTGYTYVALPPDDTQPYYGPGYQLDFPESAGNCGTCHLPGEAVKPGQAFAADPNLVEGVEQEGIFCDFCHKVWDVVLESDTQLPSSDYPGVLSFEYRRPEEGKQFFAGPFDDVAPGEDTYTPIQNESAFCAPCHFGVFWDNPIYNSYGEWLESTYSDPETGQTCQDCHMPRRGSTYFALPSVGAHKRDPETIFSHLMPGAMDIEFLQDAVTLNASTEPNSQEIKVSVEINNDNTGHKIPTDYPGRQLILLVQAYDKTGLPLALHAGPTLPEWVGVGEQDQGYYSGLPGTAYAMILEEVWTGKTPTIAYWNPYKILSDDRIRPNETAVSEYIFENPAAGDVKISIQLIFRRNFIEVMDWKQWETPDIVVQELEIIPAYP